MTKKNLSPLLKINRIIVTGELGCDIKLGSGINIVKGESFLGDIASSNDCGKTTFTDLIKYGLGDRDRFNSGSIAEKIGLLFLEVNANDETITIRRHLNKPDARVGIFLGKYDSQFSSKEPDFLVAPNTSFSDYLLEKLGIPNLRIPLSTKPGTQPTPITFQNYMRLFYMDQKNSFQEIMYRVQPEWLKGKIVEILLGMAKEEVEQLKVRVQKLTNDIDDLQKEIKNVTDFLAKSGGKNRVEIFDRLEEKRREREEFQTQIVSVKNGMMGNRGLTDKLREDLGQIGQRLIVFQENRSKLSVKINDFEALLNSLRVDREKIIKTKDAEFVLSTVDFVKCPRCLQHITQEMKQRESEGNCMVCNRPLILRPSSTSILDKDDIVEEEISEVQLLLATYGKNLEELNGQIALLENQKTIVQEELDRRSASYVSPFVDTLERLLHDVNEIDSEIELLNQQLRQWELVEQREEWLEERKSERTKLLSQISEIDTGDVTKIRKLSEYYEAFLRRVEDPELKNARINPQNMLPLVNGRPYTEDVGSGWQSVRTIAYHFAILIFSIYEPCYYPRFLMLDSPRAFDLNSKSYELLLLQFHYLQQRLVESDFQVILTTRNLPEGLEDYVIERLNNKNRMLLRPDGEREQSAFPLVSAS